MFSTFDDIFIFSKTFEEHIEHIKQVLSIFKEYKLKINIEKCHFMQTKVDVLGHKISNKGLSPQDSNIEVIKAYKKPTNVHESISFLGIIWYYRKFIINTQRYLFFCVNYYRRMYHITEKKNNKRALSTLKKY